MIDKYTFLDIGEYYLVYLNGEFKESDDDFHYLFYCQFCNGRTEGYSVEIYDWKDYNSDQPDWCNTGDYPQYLSDIDFTKFKKRHI